LDDVKTSAAPTPPLAGHWMTFFAQWLRNPLRMAAVVPSGRQLAQAMADALPPGARSVVELGPGTGAITEGVLDHGVSPEQLLLVEMNPVLAKLLRQRFPALAVACADARQLDKVLAETHGFAPGKVDAILSSLGLLAMPENVQRDILVAALRVLTPGGVFVQYTYGFAHPLAESVREELGLRCRAGRLAWLNLPPARVYVYSRG
jgi:phosphatidylethanolamine/phosphatidyl-N-methylethanolamine N-methyltransferase